MRAHREYGSDDFVRLPIFVPVALWILGNDVQSEVSTETGFAAVAKAMAPRADLVVRKKDRIYVFEFKFNRTPEEAMKQILEWRYYEKYQHEGKPIILIGLSFNYKNKKLIVKYITQPAE